MRIYEHQDRARFPRKVKEIENIFITMSDGTRLAARMWLPVDAEKKPVPAILEYLPYRKRDGTHVRDALTHPYLAGHGYAAIRVDMRGNGDSEGLMLDEYARQEQDDAIEVIAWLAIQKWCTGKVGMIGISWGGFNGLQVAARAPAALKAVVTICSTDDRYETTSITRAAADQRKSRLGGDHAGLFVTPAGPQDRRRQMEKDVAGAAEERAVPADPLAATPTPRRLLEARLRLRESGAIEAAVLRVGGWNDAYTNAVPRLMKGLRCPRKAIIGPWAHKYPHFAVPEPRIGFLQEMLRWWDQWLKGINTA